MSTVNEDNTPPDETPSMGLPSFAKYYTGEDGRPLNAELLYGSFVCEECECLKPDVVGYTLPTMFLIPRTLRFDHLVKCRQCMRRHILTRLWLAVLLAHVFSPVVFIWWVVVFVQTFYRKPA